MLLSFYSFGPMSFSRAYINFKNRDDIIKFRDQLDGYCFLDSRGNFCTNFKYQSLSHLFSWSNSQSVSQSVSRSAGQSVSRSVSQSVGQSVGWSINQSIIQSINQPVNQSISQ